MVSTPFMRPGRLKSDSTTSGRTRPVVTSASASCPFAAATAFTPSAASSISIPLRTNESSSITRIVPRNAGRSTSAAGAGRLLTNQYPAATVENITLTWDSVASGNKGKGRITRIDDASGSVEWTYDALGRATQEKKTTASVVYTVGYTYDADGNVNQMTYPSGRIVTFARNSLGQISG